MIERKGRKYADPTKSFVVHPDMLDAYQNYDGTNNSFKRVFQRRQKLVEQGIPYWNTDHDVEMRETARQRSHRPDFKFPDRRDDPTLDEQTQTFRDKLRKIWNG